MRFNATRRWDKAMRTLFLVYTERIASQAKAGHAWREDLFPRALEKRAERSLLRRQRARVDLDDDLGFRSDIERRAQQRRQRQQHLGLDDRSYFWRGLAVMSGAQARTAATRCEIDGISSRPTRQT